MPLLAPDQALGLKISAPATLDQSTQMTGMRVLSAVSGVVCVITILLLDFCSDLISIYPSYEGSKTIEYLQPPAPLESLEVDVCYRWLKFQTLCSTMPPFLRPCFRPQP